MEPVRSAQNPFVRYLLRLKKRRFREQEGKFVIEGIRLVEEAVQSGWPVERMACSGELAESGPGSRLIAGAAAEGIGTVVVEKGLFDTLAFTETPQGVLALCKMKSHSLDELVVRSKATAGEKAFLVVVDGVSDPGNLGTIIRSSDAFGAHGVVLIKGTVDLYNGKTLRSTMGSLFHLPVVSNVDPPALGERLRVEDIGLLVGVPSGGAPLEGSDLKRPLALVVGSEAAGPSEPLLSLPHSRVTITMPGRAESLNAGVAASVMMYEVARQRLQ